MKKNASSGFRFSLLGMYSEHVRVDADALFGSNDDHSSQLGFIIFLADKNNCCLVLDDSSKSAERIVQCIMAGEIYASGDAFDAAYVVAQE